MSNTLTTLKGLLVAARESLEDGNREIASNLMETALDEMEKVSAEDLDVNLQIVEDVPAVEEDAADEPDLLDEEDLEPETASEDGSLYGLVRNLKDRAEAS